MAGDSPETAIGEAVPVAVAPPGEAVTVYPVIDDPPVLAGAVNVREAEVDPVELATPTVGESGAVAGVTETGDEGLVEAPIELTAFKVML